MSPELFELHINAGRRAGRDKTCGTKVGYPTEYSAIRAAEAMNKKSTTRKPLEGYPCAFCEKWHIGRQMSLEELRSYLDSGEGT